MSADREYAPIGYAGVYGETVARDRRAGYPQVRVEWTTRDGRDVYTRVPEWAVSDLIEDLTWNPGPTDVRVVR